jgi:hypothetical protein
MNTLPDTIPEHITVEDIRYFEDKVKRNPQDKKAQLQLALIKKHFGVE